MAYRRRLARAKPKARRVRKARMGRSMGLGTQTARIQETVEFTDIQADQIYNFTFNLSQFQRASALAPSFKFYKAARVEWRIDALYNTYQEGSAGLAMPYLYSTMNRTQSAQPLNIQDLQAMGAKPKKFVGAHKMVYRPNWCTPGMLLTSPVAGSGSLVVAAPITTNGLKAVYDWISSPEGNPGINKSAGNPIEFYGLNPVPGFTTGSQPLQNVPNQCVYNGHVLFVDQLIPTTTPQTIGRVTCTVTWLFKEPNCSYALAPEDTVIQLGPKALPPVAPAEPAST